MASYAVGDVQGCFSALERVLARAQFDHQNDHLWFAGDLVNRGPQSLETLRFAKSLGARAKCVLGNHDLHTIAVAYGLSRTKKLDTLEAILQAPDKDELIEWLCQQPLIHHDSDQGYVMVHAGIPHIWSLSKAKQLASEVEQVLRSSRRLDFFAAMYGSKPHTWSDDLSGMERLRLITNYFTRMRFCAQNGKLDFKHKGGVDDAPQNMAPWFSYPLQLEQQRLLFGHWSTLHGEMRTPGLFALDTGFIWGGELSLLRLDDQQLFQVSA